MLKKTAVLGLLALCLACDPIKGQFTADQALSLKISVEVPSDWCHEGPPSSCTEQVEKTVTVPPGAYQAKLEIQSKRQMTLSIKGNQEEQRLVVQLPDGSRIPEDNGAIELSAAQIGQSYDLKGEVRTDTDRTPTRRERESCSYQDRIVTCNGQFCHDQIVTRWGWRDVEYHMLTETKNVSFRLTPPGAADAAARFEGRRAKTYKVYEYTGMCF